MNCKGLMYIDIKSRLKDHEERIAALRRSL